MNLKSNESLIRNPLLWALMGLSFVIAVVLAYILDIRFDEAFTLNTTAHGPVHAFRQAIKFEQQAPLYFVVMSIWRMASESIFFARLFSVLCIPAFIWAIAACSRRYIPEVNPLLVAAIAAIHQQVIWNALDIRLYALMMLMAALLLLVFYHAYLKEEASGMFRVIYCLIAVSALYTQYYLGFQLVAGGIALLAVKRWKAVRSYIIDMLIVGLIFAPMIFIVSEQVATVDGRTSPEISLFLSLKGLYQEVIPLMLSVHWIEPEWAKRWFTRAAVFILAFLFVRKLIKNRIETDVALGAMTFALLAMFFVTYCFLGDEGIQQRHMSNLVPVLILFPVAACASAKSKKAVFAWIVIVTALNAVNLFVTYSPMAKPGDFRRVSNYLMAHESANQPILVFHSDASLPMAFFYKGQNKLVAIPKANDFDTWDPRNNILQDESQILNRIDEQPGNPERFWLVYDGWCGEGSLTFNCELLEDVVDKYFIVESTQEFLEPTTVRLLRRK